MTVWSKLIYGTLRVTSYDWHGLPTPVDTSENLFFVTLYMPDFTDFTELLIILFLLDKALCLGIVCNFFYTGFKLPLGAGKHLRWCLTVPIISGSSR